MSKLVERLRYGTLEALASNAMLEAADRIEELEKLLSDWHFMCECSDDDHCSRPESGEEHECWRWKNRRKKTREVFPGACVASKNRFGEGEA